MIKYILSSIFILISVNVYAAPAVTNVTGTLTHGGTIVISDSGNGFGTKSPAAPVVWDDCDQVDGTDPITTYWDVRRPYNADSDHNIKYRNEGWLSVNAPHDRVNKYLVGGHDESGYTPSFDASSGPNVMVGKWFPGHSTETFYISFYYRLSPNWPHPGTAGATLNHKIVNLPNTSLPNCADLDSTSYLEFRNSVEIDGNQWHGSYLSCDNDGPPHNYVTMSSTPWDWMKIEFMGIDVNNASTGKMYIYANNVTDLIAENCDVYRGSTNPISSFSVGEYWNLGTGGGTVGYDGAYRFFADIYADITPSRVMLCNKATYASATICEPQIPSAWTADSITVTVNQGALPNGTAYLFVFDSTNTANTTGYGVTLGTTPPSAQGCTISGSSFR